MCIGFVHGVMNTDNAAISGQAIDFGPCAFLDAYRSDRVFSSIDREGRYAWGRQPSIAAWNHARLAESLLPLLHEDRNEALALANESLARFKDAMEGALLAGFARKLGISRPRAGDESLVQDLLNWMEDDRADFTTTFWALGRNVAGFPQPYRLPGDGWLARLIQRLKDEDDPATVMAASNPRIHPRNRAVQDALDTAEQGDLSPFRHLLARLAAPHATESALPEPEPDDRPGLAPFVTYCGT